MPGCPHLIQLPGSVSTDGAGRFATHAHLDAHQVIWGPAGTFVVDVEGRSWVLDPTVAMWMPAGRFHSVHTARPATMRWIYLCAWHCPSSPPSVPTLVNVTGLLLGLLDHAEAMPAGSRARTDAVAVLVDSLQVAAVAPLDVRLPRDPRALRVAIALLDDPSDGRSLVEWGREVGASVRTLSRLFQAETGESFVQWRSRVRVRASLAQLATGASVTTIAHRVGFATASSFVEAFRRWTGKTPLEYAGRR